MSNGRKGAAEPMMRMAESTGQGVGRYRFQNSNNWLRSLLFGIGDCAFLILVSTVATLSMYHAHELLHRFLPAMLIGMVAAMLVQMLLAFLVSPLLGSIESMVPSMVIAMISPMTVCTAHLFGLQPGATACVVVGAILGVVMFVLTRCYDAACRRFLRRAYAHG